MLTLKKVKELVGAPSHAKRTPSPKMLYEEGIVLLRREFDQGSHLTVYNSGYVLFSAGKRNTVFHIHDCCGDYAYDAAEGKGDVIEEEYFENCEWHMDTLPSTLWARDLYDQMHIRSDFRKWFPRMCQYGFIEGRDYEYMPRVRLQDEGGRTVQRYVKDYRITQDMAKKLCKLHHTAVGAAYHPQPFDWDALLGLLRKKPPRRSSYEAQLSDSDSLVTTTQIAKEYGCGAKVFNRLLHLHGIRYRANGQWVLYSEHHGKGYTSSLTFRLQRSDGSEVEKLHTAY